MPTIISPLITAEALIALSWYEARSKAEMEIQEEVQLMREYYDGKQITFMDARQKDYLDLHGDTYHFRLNVCRQIVDALLDELKVVGFSTDESGEVQPAAGWAWNTWQANRMDEIAEIVHKCALRDAESFVVVDWDVENNRPRFNWQQRFVSVKAGGDGWGMYFVYPDNDYTQQPISAVQEWEETLSEGTQKTRMRRTIYYPDRIERYYYLSGWQPYAEPGKTWPEWWTDTGAEGGEPIGLPVIHFKNADLASELLQAIGPQDAVNKTALDILACDDLSGFPLLWARGFKMVDKNGNPVKVGPGKVVDGIPENGEIGRIASEDVTPKLAVLDKFIILIAMITSTPVSRFVITGAVSAADTIKAQERPIQQKAGTRKVLFGNAWENVFSIALKLQNLYGTQKYAPDMLFETLWRDDRTIDELLGLQQLHFPDEMLWQMYGLTPSQIEAAKETDEYKARISMMRGDLVADETGA